MKKYKTELLKNDSVDYMIVTENDFGKFVNEAFKNETELEMVLVDHTYSSLKSRLNDGKRCWRTDRERRNQISSKTFKDLREKIDGDWIWQSDKRIDAVFLCKGTNKNFSKKALERARKCYKNAKMILVTNDCTEKDSKLFSGSFKHNQLKDIIKRVKKRKEGE